MSNPFTRMKDWSWKKKIIGVGFLLGMMVLLWRMSISKPEQNVVAMPVVKADPSIVVQGSVVPSRYSALSLPSPGVVGEISVAEGDDVKKGQPLVRFINADLTAKASAANADLVRAQARYDEVTHGSRPQEIAMKQSTVEETTAVYNMAKTNWERIRNMEEAISKRDYESYRKEYLKAQADMNHAKADYEMACIGVRSEQIKVSAAEVSTAKANYEHAISMVNQTELQAPFEGTIAYLDCRVGEHVASGKALVQLGVLSEWLVRTDDLTEIQIAKVQKGATVRMKFDALPNLELLGKVVSVRPFGEKKQGDITYTVLIKPDYFEPQLQWNMTATVYINTQ